MTLPSLGGGEFFVRTPGRRVDRSSRRRAFRKASSSRTAAVCGHLDLGRPRGKTRNRLLFIVDTTCRCCPPAGAASLEDGPKRRPGNQGYQGSAGNWSGTVASPGRTGPRPIWLDRDRPWWAPGTTALGQAEGSIGANGAPLAVQRALRTDRRAHEDGLQTHFSQDMLRLPRKG